jgi:hypothetical protein
MNQEKHPKVRGAKRKQELKKIAEEQDTAKLLEKKLTPEEKQECIQILKNSELLYKIKFELDKDHIGDDKQKMFLFCDSCSSRLKPEYRFSSALTGDTSEGKTNLWKTISKHLPNNWYLDLTRITAATLEDDVQDYNLIYFGESGANKNLLEQIKQAVEDGMDVIKKDLRNDNKTARREKQPRKVGFYSTTQNPKDKELQSRYCAISVHGNESKYQKVNDNTLYIAANFIEELERDKRRTELTWIKKCLLLLEPYDIITIPYAPLFKVNSKSSRSQRDIKRFLNLIRSITWLHQLQRISFEYEGKKVLVSSPEDFYNALSIGKEIFDQSLSGLGPRLQEVIDSYIDLRKSGVIQDIDDNAPNLDWIERNELQKDLGVSRDTIKERTEALSDLNIFRIYSKSNRVYVAFADYGSPTNLPTINPLITHGKKEAYAIIDHHYPRILENTILGTSGVSLSLDYTKSCLFSPRKSLPTKKAENTLLDRLKAQISTTEQKNRGCESWVGGEEVGEEVGEDTVKNLVSWLNKKHNGLYEGNPSDDINFPFSDSTVTEGVKKGVIEFLSMPYRICVTPEEDQISLQEKHKKAKKIIDKHPENNFELVESACGSSFIKKCLERGILEEPSCGITLKWVGGN